MSKLGRKGGMMVCSTMFCLSLLLLAAGQNPVMIYAGRFCTGVCTGITSIICPTYVAETATADKRGFLGSCVQLMVTIGVLEVIVVGVCGSWRWTTISCLAICLLWIGCLFFVPETPVYYLTKKKYREARESLEWLRGTDNVEEEFELIVKGLDESAQAGSAGPLDLFKHGNLAPFVISMWLMLGQQFSGMNAVMFYAVSIFEDTGSSMNSNVENIIIGLVQVISTVAAALVMDKLGRRILLLLSAGLMVISISLLGLYFFINDNLDNKAAAARISWLPVTSLSVFVSVFSIGFGPIPWLMMSELFSPEVKSVASSISTTFNWTLAFLVTKFFSNMVIWVTGRFFFIFKTKYIFCLFHDRSWIVLDIRRIHRSDFHLLSPVCSRDEREESGGHSAAVPVRPGLLSQYRTLEMSERRAV